MNSGTEATSTAVRLARGYTGRDRVVIFHGNFHGATDALLAAGGSGVATLGLPGTAGVPAGAVAETLVVPYNEVPDARRVGGGRDRRADRRQHGRRRARCRASSQGLRAECDRVGAVLIFDEVITGFRIGPGGAQAKYDVQPDLTTFGKVIGGGLPIGAVGGRREIMETLTPLGTVFHAGTLAGNPIATAAGLAALNVLDGDVYIELMARARHLASMLRDACSAAGFAAQFPVVGTLIGMYCGEGDLPTNFAEAKQHRRAGLRPLLPRDARRGRGDGAGRLRGDLRRPRPHRRRPRPDRRRGRPGRRSVAAGGDLVVHRRRQRASEEARSSAICGR